MTKRQSRRTQRALEQELFGPEPAPLRRARPPKKTDSHPPPKFRQGDCAHCGNFTSLDPAHSWECTSCGRSYSSDSPIIVYTGTKVWEGRPTIGPSKKGRVEHGPGLYFTTSLATATKYSGGSRTVLRVEIDPSFTWLEDAAVPMSTLVDWVRSRRGLRSKEKILADIEARAGRGLPDGMARPMALVYLMVNYDAVTGDHGPALAEFLASLGIGASHVNQGREDWIVLFDPSKVISWERVTPDAEWDLPRLRRTSR